MKKEKIMKIKIWGIVFICIFAISVCIAIPFLINASYIKNEGFITVWNGADLLAFYGAVLGAIGTISLGALSLWQNHQLSKINEKAQGKIGEISKRANEINIISKIIEHEEVRLQQLRASFDKYNDFCDPTSILSKTKNKPKEERHSITDKLEKENELLYNSVFNYLSWNTNDDRKFKFLVVELNMRMFKFIREIREKGHSDMGLEVLDKKLELTDYYNDYFKKYQTQLESMLFKDLSLDEVRKLYERVEEEE